MTVTAFVGGEYLIAWALLKKANQNKRLQVTYEELHTWAREWQREFNQHDIDAVIIDYDLLRAVHEYSECFEALPDGTGVKLVETCNLSHLKYRFLGYLPLEILVYVSQNCLF